MRRADLQRPPGPRGCLLFRLFSRDSRAYLCPALLYYVPYAASDQLYLPDLR